MARGGSTLARLPALTDTRRDRRIAALALPALGALAAEPLYVLADAAIVGHLGTAHLAGLAVAGAVLSSAFWLLNFLSYGTTAHVARLWGAGRRDEAAGVGAQALWLALGLGVLVAVALVVAGRVLIEAMGAGGEAAGHAWTYLWISALGSPFALVALAAQGYLRGVLDMRTPLVVLLGANVLNVVLELWLVFGLDTGIAGSALSTVVAQGVAAALLVPHLLRRPGRPSRDRMRPLVRLGGDLMVRTGALLGAFLLATAVLARVGDAAVAGHEVAFRAFILLALVLDAVAIAAQALIGTTLGAGDGDEARALARRMVVWGLAAGVAAAGVLAALAGVVPGLFTDDPDVVDQVARIWWIFVLMQPANAVVFVLDGVLMGAGDTRYLMWCMLAAVAAFVAVMLAGAAAGWGITGVWAGLCVLLAIRLATNLARWRGGRWTVTGVDGPRPSGAAVHA